MLFPAAAEGDCREDGVTIRDDRQLTQLHCPPIVSETTSIFAAARIRMFFVIRITEASYA